MATSGSSDFALTSRQVVTAALKLVGAVGIGQTPSAEDATEALLQLNLCLKTWGTEPRLWITTTGTQALTASQGSYVLSAARRIIGVRRRTSNVDTPLMEISRQEYDEFPTKSQTGVPFQYYFDPQRSVRTLYVINVPDAGTASSTSLVYTYQRVIEDSDTLDDDPDVPQEWLEALIYAVAARLTVPYSLDTTNPAKAQQIRQMAGMLYEQLTEDSDEDASLFIQPALRK